ncbi:glycine--tRNA ligase [Candidatus Micrarchaeota archaeon]|nr:glycine--tRNA ligase [Candidatus Micrarchaeota archaeon]
MLLHERIFELALSRGIFYPSNEIYENYAGFYDYGPVGTLIKNRIENLWRREFVRKEGFMEIQTSIITPKSVLDASGHTSSITDPVVECLKCKKRMRADHLMEGELGIKWDGNFESLKKTFKEKNLQCPSCKANNLGEPYVFNLMFKTGIGVELQTAFLRPETAQGVFVNFTRNFRENGTKLPLGVAQIGKSFRNEISPRRGLVRMREFTQMELEYYFDPDSPDFEGFENVRKEKVRIMTKETQKAGKRKIEWKTGEQLLKEKICPNQIFAYFLIKEWEFYKMCGISEEKMHFRVLFDDEVPHYSSGNIDLEVETSYGIIETIGNAYRTDFDLSQHSSHSGKSLSVKIEGKEFIPHVFEVSMGVDRLIFCLLEHTFREKTSEKEWEWFDIPPQLSPFQTAVFPLMKKAELDEKAKKVRDILREEFYVFYQKSGSIGKRYARADEIGIPYAVTIDYDTLDEDTVTIRYRNNARQERIKISDLILKIKENVDNAKVS